MFDENEIKIKKKKKKEKKRESVDVIDCDADVEVSPSKKKKKVHLDENGEQQNDEMFSPTSITSSEDGRKKKKKKKKSLNFVKEPSPPLNDDEDIVHANDEDDEVMKYHEDVDEVHELLHEGEHKVEPAQENDYFGGWPKEDLEELFNKIISVIPKNDTLKYNSRVNKLEWEKVAFKSYSAQECQEKWKFIEKKLRGYRILSELISDAYTWLEKPWTHFYHSTKKNRHPDMPKRPLTSYMLFYVDKKKKFSKKYPNLEMSKLSKLMAEKFKNLPESKKEKYHALAATMREEYKENLQKFFDEHPLEAKLLTKKTTKPATVSRSGPKKPLTPFKIFLQDKLKQIEGPKTQTDIQAIHAQCKEKWNSMSTKKKIPWIRWAQEGETKYLEEMKLYTDNVVIPYKSVLSKKERIILERMDGKPDKPPRSAYSLFSRIMLKDPKLKEKFETPKERMQEIARLWKEVPKSEKDEYAEKVKHLMEDYKMEFATYLETLPVEKREEELATTKPKKKQKLAVEPSLTTPGKKLKQTTITSVMKKLISETETKMKSRPLEELIKLEPEHPPESPFALFKNECLAEGLSSKKAIKAWDQLGPAEKKKYNEKLENLKTEYITKFRNFLSSIKPEELKAYSNYRGNLMKEASLNEESGEEEEEDDGEGEVDEDEEEEAQSEVDGQESDDS